MTFNDDRTECIGKVNLLMNIRGTGLLLVANSMRIQSIAYTGKTITPKEKLCIYSIKISRNNTIIESLQ
ncbi:hypothetical protein [Prevotella sp.]|uniref:hypothetical protein n=1 Tax=Prevotella sp. TaxID=59823 RepID=UPI003DA53B62